MKYVGVRAEGITATGVNLDKGMVQGAGLIAKTYIDPKMFEINPNKANFNKVMANGGTWLQAGKGIVSDALYVADPINSLNYHFNLNLSVSEAANYSQSVINTAMIAEPAANLAQFGADAASSLYSKAIPRISNAMETASEAARNTAMQPNMPGFGNIGGFTNPFDSILSYTKTFKEVIGSDKPTYSRSIPEGWQKLKMDKSFNQIREENGWKQGNITINNSKERSAKIFDSNGNKIGDVHFGHKETYGNGPDKKVTQDHYHLDADEDNIHYVLPDKK